MSAQSEAPSADVHLPDGIVGSHESSRITSWWSRHEIPASELLIVGLGALFVVAYYPEFLYVRWTPRALLVAGVLPFGILELLRLSRARDRGAQIACILIGWAVFTSLISRSPWVSALGAFGRQESTFSFAAGLGCWAIGRRLSDRGRTALAVTFVASCLASGLVGVLQIVFGVQLGTLATLESRASGFSMNPVYLGATAAGAAAVCAIALSQHSGNTRRAASLGLAGAVFVATITGTRSALAAGVFVVLVCAVREVRRGRVREAGVLIAVTALGAAIGTVFLRLASDDPALAATERLGSGGLWPRLQLWKYGLQAIVDRPITGYGLGRYRPAVQEHFTPRFVREQGLDDISYAWFESHNMVMQILVGLGVVGLALSIAFLVIAFRQSRGPLAWASACIALCWMFQPAGYQTFQLAALLLGASAPRVTGELFRSSFLRRTGWALASVASLVLVTWLAVTDMAAKSALEKRTEVSARNAADWGWRDPHVIDDAVSVLFDPRDPDEATKALVLELTARSAEIEPDFPYWWVRLGTRQILYGDPAGARVSLERAIALQPYHPLSLQLLATIALREGDDELLSMASARLEALGLDVPTREAVVFEDGSDT